MNEAVLQEQTMAVGLSESPQSVPHIMIVVGEPSGDALGAQLMDALYSLTSGRVRLSGMGGDAMARAGLSSLFSIADTSVMGLREIVPAIPRILKRVRQVADYAERVQPDVIVLIDSPDFTHRIARRLARRAPHLKVVKYVAPQVWASRPRRAAKLAEMVDCVMTLLPFEPEWFTREGLLARFVGHPVIERVGQMRGGPALRERYGIAPDKPVLLMLPGSRSNEIRFILPIFKDAVSRLRLDIPDLETVLPVVPQVAERIREAAEEWPGPLHLVGQDEKFAAFDASNVALATSGTVTTELALARVPMVVAYRVGWLTGRIFRDLMIAPFATLINIIQERGVIPEYLQEAARADVLSAELLHLFTDEAARNQQVSEQHAALRKMGLGGDSPSIRAGRVVLDMLSTGPSPVKVDYASRYQK